ncbi:MAG: hypothetical protein J1E83_06600 [Lachnospiraceae bacterium]|nr:hypothetical protein [Lachnospiraceae bacterium]
MLENMRKTVPDKVIESCLIVIGMAEAAHLTALLLKLPFGVCSTVFAVLLALGILWKAGTVFLRRKRGERFTGQEEIFFSKLWKTYPGWVILPGIMIILQIVWYYWIQTPYLKYDITGEIVQTMLASDSIYEVNPLTGQAFDVGMPMRLKILVLPTLFASVCRWTGLSAMTICYSVAPGIVLLLSYTVYLGWAEYLFPKEGKKRMLFLLFAVFIYQFGAYSRPMDGYSLFFGGFQGEAFRTGIILPYALLCCLRGRWKGVVLCLLAEVCMVWTFYGLGYTAVTAVLYGCIRLLSLQWNRREK